MSPSNPFFPGIPIPPEYFIGRESVIRTAFDLIAQRSHLAIYGGSGMGKSSLLQYLSSRKVWEERGRSSSEALIVYCNCTDISPFTPPAFWRKILDLLRYEAEGNIELGLLIDTVLQQDAIVAGDLRRILRTIGQGQQFLLLLLDEYDFALRAHDSYSEAEIIQFLREFRNLAIHNREGRHLSTIVTTCRRLEQVGPAINPNDSSPWYNHYIYRVLRPFSPGEIADLFSRYQLPQLQHLLFTLAPKILAITGGNTQLLHEACYLLYETIRDGNQLTPETFPETFIDEFQQRTQPVYYTTWNFLTEKEQGLLMLIALSRLAGLLNNRRFAINDAQNIFNRSERELIDLEERGIIKCQIEEGNKTYRFASYMIEWWVVQEIANSNDDPIEIQQRERVFLQLMTNQQKEQVFKVIHLTKQVFNMSLFTAHKLLTVMANS